MQLSQIQSSLGDLSVTEECTSYHPVNFQHDWLIGLTYIFPGKRNWSSQTVQRRDNSFPRSQDCPGPSSQRNELSQRNARSVRSAGSNLSSSQSTVLQNMDNQEMTQLVGCMIRYLLVADRSRLPIHRTHIIKNALNGNNRQFQLLIDTVKENLLKVNSLYSIICFRSFVKPL